MSNLRTDPVTAGNSEPDDSVCFYCGFEYCCCNDDCDDDNAVCSWCGGDGEQENDDPLWHGFDVDFIPCECCAGTGLSKFQTVF